jgi:hypothetical protein
MNLLVEKLIEDFDFDRGEAIDELRTLRFVAAETMDPEGTLLDAGIIPTDDLLFALQE